MPRCSAVGDSHNPVLILSLANNMVKAMGLTINTNATRCGALCFRLKNACIASPAPHKHTTTPCQKWRCDCSGRNYVPQSCKIYASKPGKSRNASGGTSEGPSDQTYHTFTKNAAAANGKNTLLRSAPYEWQRHPKYTPQCRGKRCNYTKKERITRARHCF